MILLLQRDNIVGTSISLVHTYPLFYLKTEQFFLGFATCTYLVKTVTEKNLSFQNRSLEWRFF